MRLICGLLVATAMFAFATPAGAATSTAPISLSTSHPGVDRVLVISLPAVSWADLNLARLPNLSRLFNQSAVADLSVRGVGRVPSLADGYVTMSAGTRADGHAGDDGECLDSRERIGETTAQDEMARRVGTAPGSIGTASIVCLAQHEIVSHNSGLLFDAEIGALGDSLAAAGVTRGVIANGDTTLDPGTDSDYQRSAALALTDHNGIVPEGDVGPSLLMRDRSAPFGFRLDPERVLAAFAKVWDATPPRRAVVLVEASDLLRLEAYAGFVSRAALIPMEQRVYEDVDELVGRLLAHVDAARDAVMVVAPVQRSGASRLTVVSLRAPGLRPGFAVSSWTRHSGIVSIVDIGPTILNELGLTPPSRMEGRPMTFARAGGSESDRVSWLVDTNQAAQFRDRQIGSVVLWFAIFEVVVIGAAILAFTWLGGRSRNAVQFAALTLIGFVCATFLAGLLPFYRYGADAYWLFLLGIGASIAAIAWFATDRSGLTTLIVALSGLVALISIDVVTGARLQFDTVFGYSPTVAGRYSGLGNLGYAPLAAGTVLLAGLIAERLGGRRGVGTAIGLLGVAIIVDGAPFFGSDIGGVLSMVPAFAITGTLLLGWRLRWRLLAAYGSAALVLLAVFAVIDISRPAPKRTQLARLVSSAHGQGGLHSVWTLVDRKLQENLGVLFGSTWTLMLPLVAAGVVYLVYRAPGSLRGLSERMPAFSIALAGFAIVAVLGTALNDSGIAITGVMVGVLSPVLIVIVLRGGGHRDERMKLASKRT